MKVFRGIKPGLVLLLNILGLIGVISYPDYPANEYEYSIKRQWLKEDEREYQGKVDDLTQDEQIVNNYLEYLKWDEFQKTKDTDFPPSRPIEEMMEHIMNSEVYRVLLNFPKGGNMHTHENHQLSKSAILDLVYASEDFGHLFMLPGDHPTDPWKLDFFVNPPVTEPAWINIAQSNYTKEEILEHQTFLGILSDKAKSRPTDTGLRWSELNVLWSRMSSVLRNVNIKGAHIEAMIMASLDEGVQYLESRKHLGPDETIYELDESCVETYGKCALGDAELELNITREVVDRLLAEEERFIGMRRVMYTNRRHSFAEVRESMERAVDLHTKYPEEVVAFDMVGEEDSGNSHLYYLRNFLELYNDVDQRSDIALKLHTAETNWPDDLITSNNELDPVGTLQNSYEAVLLGSNRLGHALGLIKHPYLLNLVKERGVAIESCPVSNQIIGFTPDLRTHPAINYMRHGIPVILGTDDPGTFGYDHFTIDWYEVYMAWGLDLVDLKTLALNSLRHSSMTSDQAETAITEKWQPAYDEYIQTLLAEACNTANLTQATPVFGAILPKDGALEGGTRVDIYGRHFERGICPGVQCRFGSSVSEIAEYVSPNHLACIAPQLADGEGPTVAVHVSLDGGLSFLATSANFTYMYDTFSTGFPPVQRAAGMHVFQTYMNTFLSLVLTGAFHFACVHYYY